MERPMEVGGSRHQMRKPGVHPRYHEAIVMPSTRDLRLSMHGSLLLVDLVHSKELHLHEMRNL